MLSKIKWRKLKRGRLQPVQVLALGFVIIIFVGAVLLMLPISSSAGRSTPFVDALFTATSATCVTGLVTLDTGTYWSIFGQIIILLMIQVGALGLMTFTTMLAIIVGKRISFRNRLIMQEAYNTVSVQGIVRMVLNVVVITLTIEMIGAIVLATQFVPVFGWKRGLFYGLFHSVSAFCNAGFDLLGGYSGQFSSLTGFSDNGVLVLTISALITLGGLGFSVILDIIRYKKAKRMSLNSKVVLYTTALLIVGGTILFYIFESGNPNTMGTMVIKDKLINSIFAAVTPRTAGFNTISTSQMSVPGKFLTMIFMFVGASPGSTGGGIKTTTAALILLTVLMVIKGREDVQIFHKRIPKALIDRAVAITIISFTLVVAVTMMLSVTEIGSLETCLYEATSAFGTVGLTQGLTPSLSTTGKIAVLLTMYAGRVGPLSLALAFAFKAQAGGACIRYPEDKILVG